MVRFKEPLVIKPWQAPINWGEITAAANAQGIDLFKKVRNATKRIRDGKPHILLVGFPIPEFFDDRIVRMHWQAIKLPELMRSAPYGFRNKEAGYWQGDKNKNI